MYVCMCLSFQGDRMWAFAISIFLMLLTPNSLRLVAIYGVTVSLSVVAFGALVGDWIDATPRLKGYTIVFLSFIYLLIVISLMGNAPPCALELGTP